MTGTLSTLLGRLSVMTAFFMNSNSFAGTIPTEISAIPLKYV